MLFASIVRTFYIFGLLCFCRCEIGTESDATRHINGALSTFHDIHQTEIGLQQHSPCVVNAKLQAFVNPCLHRMIGLLWLATTPNKELRLEYKSSLLPLSCLENCRFSNISVTKKTIYYNDSYALPIGGNLSSPCTIMCPVSF